MPLYVAIECVRPPIGLKPKRIHDEQRWDEVQAAIRRYREAGLQVPVEWYEEFHSLSIILGF